jgi:hypothetical protein
VQARQVAVAVAARAARVLQPQPQTLRELPVELENLTLFLERPLHTHREATAVLVATAPTERLVLRTEVTAAEAVTATQLRTVEMEVLE